MDLTKVKVKEVKSGEIIFEKGISLFSYHEKSCCENHWLSFANLDIGDFEGLDFNLSGDSFFERIDGYGIALKPNKGFPIRIPGYSSNNGYYSSNLTLILEGENYHKEYDITDCQDEYMGQEDK